MKKRNLGIKYPIKGYSDLIVQAVNGINQQTIGKIVDLIWATYESGNTLFFAGNGGSASTASHMAADLGKNTINNHSDTREDRLKTISLCDNIAWISAVSNDISFDDVFVEQLKSLAKPGDLLIIFSGSGKSMNIIKAVAWAKENNLRSVGILGFDGGYVKDFSDLSIIVESTNYGIVESTHSHISHFIVEVLKKMKSEKNL